MLFYLTQLYWFIKTILLFIYKEPKILFYFMCLLSICVVDTIIHKNTLV
jgi:hypothetical protein